jgi:hypothetical protein
VGTVKLERHASTLVLAWGEWFGPAALCASLALLAAQLLGGR